MLTNVSSDHLDLQGIHTLPELAEVKSTICRITKPSGWVVLNADDALVAAVARRVKANVALFTLEGDASRAVRRHRARGGRAYLVRDGVIVEANGEKETRIVEVAEVPITIGAGSPQRGQRAGRGRWGARPGRHDRPGPRGAGRFRPERRALARPAQPVPPRRQGGDRRFRA